MSDVRIVDLSSARVCEKKSRDICANAEVSQFDFSGVNHLPTEMLTPNVEEKNQQPNNVLDQSKKNTKKTQPMSASILGIPRFLMNHAQHRV